MSPLSNVLVACNNQRWPFIYDKLKGVTKRHGWCPNSKVDKYKGHSKLLSIKLRTSPLSIWIFSVVFWETALLSWITYKSTIKIRKKQPHSQDPFSLLIQKRDPEKEVKKWRLPYQTASRKGRTTQAKEPPIHKIIQRCICKFFSLSQWAKKNCHTNFHRRFPNVKKASEKTNPLEKALWYIQ